MYEQIYSYQPQTVLLCNKRLYFGNRTDYYIVFGMWTAYIVISCLFLLTLNSFIIEQISATLGIFSYFLSIPGFVSAVLCFTTEPGVIPRGNLPSPNISEDKQAEVEKDSTNEQVINESSLTDEVPSSTMQSNEVQQIEQEIELQMSSDTNPYRYENQEDKKRVKRNLLMARYCSTCKIMRPPLASHCSSCNHCVKTYDHHCVFMGNCIGERNQKWFVLFLIFTFIWSMYALIFAVINAIDVVKSDETVIQELIENKQLFYPLIGSGVLLLISLSLRCHPTVKGLVFLIAILILLVNVVYSVLENMELKLIDNPVTCIGFVLVYAVVVLFVMPHTCFNLSLAFKGSTQKQDHFYAFNPQLSNQSYSFSNCIGLLTKRTIPSEIIS